MRKPNAAAEGTPAHVGGVDSEFSERFPCVWEHVSHQHWDDSTPRVTSTMYWFVEEGVWTLVFGDRALGLVAFVKGDTFTGVLLQMEKSLCAGSVDWRRDKKAAGRGRK
jgi:hypothetical protein